VLSYRDQSIEIFCSEGQGMGRPDTFEGTIDLTSTTNSTMGESAGEPQTILFLAANPKDTGRLRLDQELRDIAEGLQRAQQRDQFVLEQRWAVRPRDIQRAIMDVGPHIIHFSGHGTGEAGLVFEDAVGNAQPVEGDALAGLFELFADRITCVVLNGCYSEVQAQAVAQHIPYVIGMHQAIGDGAAIAFAVGFYDALGAGRDVEFAYKLGCAAIRLEGIAEHLTPVLVKQPTSAKPAAATEPSAEPSEGPQGGPRPSAAASLQKRLALFQRLSSLPGPQFEQVVFALRPPAGNVPPASAPLGQRVSALLEWAESPMGCGLETLEQVLALILDPQ
jgi:hypothetical protein